MTWILESFGSLDEFVLGLLFLAILCLVLYTKVSLFSKANYEIRLKHDMVSSCSQRTQFTTKTRLPSSITRESVVGILHNHEQFIGLSPIVVDWHPIATPRSASSDELLVRWYRIRERVQCGCVKFDAGFRNLDDGVQTRVYAPLGLKFVVNWTLCEGLPGDLQGEASEKVIDDGTESEKGWWLREDVDMECRFFLTWFVKRTMKKSHAEAVQRLISRAQKLPLVDHNPVL